MILSVRIVKKPQKVRRCANCDMLILEEQIKLYGMAHYKEKPHNIFLHPKCASNGSDQKVADSAKSQLQLEKRKGEL